MLDWRRPASLEARPFSRSREELDHDLLEEQIAWRQLLCYFPTSDRRMHRSIYAFFLFLS